MFDSINLPKKNLNLIGVCKRGILYAICEKSSDVVDNKYELWSYHPVWRQWNIEKSDLHFCSVKPVPDPTLPLDFAEVLEYSFAHGLDIRQDVIVICQCQTHGSPNIAIGCFHLSSQSWTEYTCDSTVLLQKSNPILFCNDDIWFISGRDDTGSHFYEIRLQQAVCDSSSSDQPAKKRKLSGSQSPDEPSPYFKFDLVPLTYLAFPPEQGIDVLSFEHWLHVQGIEQFEQLHRFNLYQRCWENIHVLCTQVGHTASTTENLSLQVYAAGRIYKVHGRDANFLRLEMPPAAKCSGGGGGTGLNLKLSSALDGFKWLPCRHKVPGKIWRLSADTVPCVGNHVCIYLKMERRDELSNVPQTNTTERLFSVFVEVPTLEMLAASKLIAKHGKMLKQLNRKQLSELGLGRPLIDKYFAKFCASSKRAWSGQR